MKAFLIVLGLLALPSGAAESYRFISGQDVWHALSQDSMVVQGYLLGVVDSMKHQDHSCFTVPLSPTADADLYSGYLEYWQGKPIPEDAVEAITQAMSTLFPCTEAR